MWILEFGEGLMDNDHTGHVWLKPGTTINVCRKKMPGLENVLLVSHNTVSRHHATFEVSHTHLDPQTGRILKPTVTLRDLSRMGTIINDGRITSGSGETLSENDKISFGAHVEDGEPMCKLVWRPLVFSASGFKKTAKAKLKETCVGMGVSIDDSQKIPADARYLLMTELTVTQKVVVALARGIEIVSERFLDALDRKVSFLNFAFPAASKYLPEEKETNVIGQAIGWGPNPARKNLFKGVQFLTLIDTMQKRVQETVELCGGKVICMPLTAETSLDEIIAVAKQPNTLVLTNSRNDSQDMGYEYDHAFEMLRGLGKRVIEEQEVAYAVLAASREEHTNPDIDYDPLSKYESQQSSIGGTGEVRDNVPVASSARHRPNQAVASTQAVPKQAPPDAATSATSQAAILAPATQSGPQAPEIRKATRTTRRAMRPDEFLDSMLDEAMASLPPVQPNSLSQAGAGSAFADTQSKRRHSQEEATQRKRVRVDPLAFLDEIAQPQADDKAAMPPVAPTASTKKVVLPAETQSQNESVPATEKSSRQFSQSFKRVEEAPAVEVDMEEAQDWKAPPEDMYRAPKPGDPGYEYLLQDPDDEEKPEVAFDDIPAGKPAKTGKKSKDLAPEKVAKLARKVAQALKDQNDVTKDEAIMEGLVGKTRVVFGAVVKEPERRPTEKKGSRKGKEKDVWGRPNFKRFRKNYFPGAEGHELPVTIQCAPAGKDDGWSDRVWLTEKQDPQLHRRGLAGGASAEARSQYESIEEVQAEPDQEGEEEVFDEFAVAPSRKTKKTASIVGGSDARSMVSGTRSRAGGRYLGRGSDDEDSISNDSLLNFIPPKSTRTGGSRGKSKLVEAIKIADSEESDEDDPTKFRLRR